MAFLDEEIYTVVEQLKDNAYGVTIHIALEKKGVNISLYKMYQELKEMVEDGRLNERFGSGGKERGYRLKHYFFVPK